MGCALSIEKYGTLNVTECCPSHGRVAGHIPFATSGYGYIGARNDTTQQSGQTPDKGVEIKKHYFFREGITKCSDVYSKVTGIRQHKKHLLEYIGYMFRPVNRLSSGHQSSKSKVLLRYWDPNIYSYIQYKIWY